MKLNNQSDSKNTNKKSSGCLSQYRNFDRGSKLLLFFIFFLLALQSSVFASKKLVFEGNILPDSTIVIDNQSLSVGVAENHITVLGSSIELGECKSFGNTEFCYVSYSAESKSAYTNIYRLIPDIGISRSFDDQNLVLGQKTKLSISITNEGDYRAEEFYYSDEYPLSLRLTNAVGDCIIVEKENESIIEIRNKTLLIGESLSCVVDVEAVKTTDLKLVGSYHFFNGNSIQKGTTAPNNILISSGLSFYVPENIEEDIGSSFDYAIIISNNNDIKLNLDIGLLVPSILKVDNQKDFTDNHAEFTILPKESKEFKITLRAKKNGIAELTSIIKYSDEDNELVGNEIKSSKVSVSLDDIVVESNFVSDNEEVQSGQKIILTYTIKNPNNDVNFTDIKVNFNSDLFYIEDNHIDVLKEFQSKKILNRIFITPEVDSAKKYFIALNINYTVFNQTLSKTIKKYITVKPRGTLLVSHELSKKDIYPSDEIEITTYVKNTKNIDITDACIEDRPLQAFSKIDGLTKICFNINADETKELLKYSVKANKPGEGIIQSRILVDLDYESENNNLTTLVYNESYTISQKKIDNENLKVKIQPESEYYKGLIINIPVEVTNSGENTLYNISYVLPHLKEFDYIKDKIFVKKLDPGESIVVDKAFSLRAKKAGLFKFPDKTIYYDGDNLLKYSTTITDFSLKILSNEIDSPQVSLERIFKNNTFLYKIENSGNPVKAKLYDPCINFSKNIALSKDSFVTISVKLDNLANKFCAEARVKYVADNFNLTTYSNELNIFVVAEDNNLLNSTPINESKLNQSNEASKTKSANYSVNKSLNADKINKTKSAKKERKIEAKKNLIKEIIGWFLKLIGLK